MADDLVAQADRLDAVDPLRAYRERFVIDDNLVYLDGNSLGHPPADTSQRMQSVIDQWGTRLIRGWDDGWFELGGRLGDHIGAGLIGAGPGQVALADSTTVCLYKLAAAALAARPGRGEIVTDRDNFPTNRYVLESLAAERGHTIRWLDCDPTAGPGSADVAEAVGPDTALVALSHVAYRSGFLADMPELTRVAHAAGALTLWDLCHSVGAIPVALDQCGADLAVGCTYKYLNGGPGAPAFLYVRTEHQATLRQPIWGWVGRADPFAMAQGYEPGSGIAGMLSGTPPVLALAAVEAGIAPVLEAGIDAIRRKAVALTEYAIALHDDWLAPLGVQLASPRESSRRGAHVALAYPRAAQLVAALTDRGVIGDFRRPNVIRIGLSPLTTRFSDVRDGLEQLRELLTD